MGKMAEEWIASLDEENRERLLRAEKDAEEDEEEDEDKSKDPDAWAMRQTKHETHVTENDGQFRLSKTWKQYKDYIREDPDEPRPDYDLTKWTEEDKKQYSFDSMDSD